MRSKSRLKAAFQAWILRHLSLYPPYIGAGIRVRRPELDSFRVEMKLRWFNRNAVGTHFGGSLYSMCDPHFMLILIAKLGPGYIVWDKAASIRLRRPGRGKVSSEFRIPDEEVEEIRKQADRGETVEPRFEVKVVDEEGELVARVEKLLYVRKREAD
ncbi:MAG: DUF4442 domain-containing protein [Thermoanaerobaculia bacterium]